MDSNRKTEIIVGILFIIATVAPIVSAVPLGVVPLGFLGTEGIQIILLLFLKMKTKS